MRWVGHIWRSVDIPVHAIKWRPNLKRCLDRIKKDVRMLGVVFAEKISMDGKKLMCIDFAALDN